MALGDIGFAAWAASTFAAGDAGRVDRDMLLAELRAFGVEYADTTLVAEADEVCSAGGRGRIATS